jgi:hypothetical protein
MKKILILLLAAPLYSAPSIGEVYACSYEFNFTLKRIIHSKTLEQFQYQVRDETPLLYSITHENNNYIYLQREIGGGASNLIVGKRDNTLAAVWLKHNNSSEVFNGECFLVR